MPESLSDEPVFSRRDTVVFCILAGLVPMIYALFTGQIWEDFFITFKFSQNLCEGKGLVYEPGVRVHGFTSPLGVLLPALGYLLTGCRSYLGAIWAFRLFCCIPAFVAGGLILIRLMSRETVSPRRAAAWAVGMLYVFEAKSAAFSVNGMETALMLLFLAWALDLTRRETPGKWLPMGIAWGGLMWTRPDSCIYVAVLVLAEYLFAAGNRRAVLLGAAKAAAVTTAIYLPWFIWAWFYYGTPVPHTITAKAGTLPNADLVSLVFRVITRLPSTLSLVFAPPYVDFSAWPVYVRIFSYALGWFCAGYWVFCPAGDRLGRVSSFSFFLLCLYMAGIPLAYPWYLPPVAMLGLVILVRGATAAAGFLGARVEVPRPWFAYLTVLLAVYMASLLTLEAISKRLNQRLVDYGTRRQVGEWLHDHAAPGERVYLECLGYIGYFSGCRMLDYPGLASPEVARLVREQGLNFVSLVAVLRPEWIVLRVYEIPAMQTSAYFRENYEVVHEVDSRPAVAEWLKLPGGNLYYDSCFVIFRHRHDDMPEKQETAKPGSPPG